MSKIQEIRGLASIFDAFFAPTYYVRVITLFLCDEIQSTARVTALIMNADKNNFKLGKT